MNSWRGRRRVKTDGTWSKQNNPTLIFIDLRLPGEIDGYELLRRLKRDDKFKHIPAIVLTAYGQGDAEIRSKAAGCDDFFA